MSYSLDCLPDTSRYDCWWCGIYRLLSHRDENTQQYGEMQPLGLNSPYSQDLISPKLVGINS